ASPHAWPHIMPPRQRGTGTRKSTEYRLHRTNSRLGTAAEAAGFALGARGTAHAGHHGGAGGGAAELVVGGLVVIVVPVPPLGDVGERGVPDVAPAAAAVPLAVVAAGAALALGERGRRRGPRHVLAGQRRGRRRPRR